MSDIKNNKVLLSWKVHMAKHNISRAISALILILICVYFVNLTLEDGFLTLVSFFVLLMMVLPYYLPNTFILSDEGVEKKMLFSKQTRKWSEFHRYEVGKNAVNLYTMNKKSRLDNYRSFLIICHQNKDKVIKIVEEKLKINEKREP